MRISIVQLFFDLLLNDPEPVSVTQSLLANPPGVQPLGIPSVAVDDEPVPQVTLCNEQGRSHRYIVRPKTRLDTAAIQATLPVWTWPTTS